MPKDTQGEEMPAPEMEQILHAQTKLIKKQSNFNRIIAVATSIIGLVASIDILLRLVNDPVYSLPLWASGSIALLLIVIVGKLVYMIFNNS